MSNNKIPRWNLDSIFSSINSPEYKKAIDDYTNGMQTLEELLQSAKTFIKTHSENFDFPAWLSGYLKADDKVQTLAGTLNAYAYIIYSVDTTNTDFLNNISKIEEIGLRYNQIDIEFSQVLLMNSKYLDDFYKRFPEFAEYKYLLEETLEDTKHQMSAQEENLASDLQRTGGDAWDRLHEQIISNLKDENGKTFNEIRNEAYSADANVRKSAWQKEIALLKQNEIAIAACLNNLKGETVTLNKRRKWQNAIDRALASSRLSKKTLDALIGAIEDSLPAWRKYFQLKAKYLRENKLTASETAGTNGKGIAFYDLFAPMANANESDKNSLLSKNWTFDEARDYIIERYNSFSKPMGEFARNAFDKNWIDAEVRPGKVGGAYDEDFAINNESRILSNFTGAFSDIITLAHELGHAYHFSCMKGKPAAFYSYPMTLAETASTFAETIVKQDMMSKCSGSEKLQILDLDLQDTSQTLVDILSRFYFERSVFEARKDGELSAEDFNNLMKKAQADSYGDGLNDERHEYLWAVKSHYYSTALDFYNFPYAFGTLFGAGLYSIYKKEGKSFADRYAELLSHTGSMSCEELCKQAGFDITTKDFWKSGIEMYTKEIEEFEKLVNSN
ncbi:M3 family oligoendopeptidase [Treponema zioleckii]|uniref:M3 family oligoendopeptidase n=1 Tax=Treponema zioleckii TaxID=331680 RepID=UPI00168BBE1F|nr:M3 family oligoendopeptidase [Treponema zioleckii]